MATDISLLNNVVQVTVDGGQPSAYADTQAKYSFDAAGAILNLALYPSRDTYSVAIANLRIAGSGSAPANAAAAYTALSTVFQK